MTFCLHAHKHPNGVLSQLISDLEAVGFQDVSRERRGGYLFVNTKKWVYQITEVGKPDNTDSKDIMRIVLRNKRKLFWRHIIKRN